MTVAAIERQVLHYTIRPFPSKIFIGDQTWILRYEPNRKKIYEMLPHRLNQEEFYENIYLRESDGRCVV